MSDRNYIDQETVKNDGAIIYSCISLAAKYFNWKHDQNHHYYWNYDRGELAKYLIVWKKFFLIYHTHVLISNRHHG